MESYMQKNETWLPNYTIHKNKFKVDKRLKYKLWHHKSPRGKQRQENIRHSLCNIFTDMSPRARDVEERIKKWDHIKLNTFCKAKENSIKMKREPTIWYNIFVHDTSEKALISKIYKYHTRLHSRKSNNPIKKWAKDLNRHLSEVDTLRTQTHMKTCSASLAIREIQINTTMRYYLSPVRMAIINKSTNKCWRGCGEKGTQVHS